MHRPHDFDRTAGELAHRLAQPLARMMGSMHRPMPRCPAPQEFYRSLH